jgi:beta-D-xylosidase 4
MSSSKLFPAAAKVLLPFIAVHTGVQASSVCSTSGSASAAAYNASANYLGCYMDPSVSILTAAKLSTIIITPQYCATWCGERGFAYGGVEFGT